MRTIDVRGQACPTPVILARKGLLEDGEITVIVDSDTAQLNVTRMAEKAGASVTAEVRPDGIYLHILKASLAATTTVVRPDRGPAVILVQGNTLGRGNEELGNILIRAFFHSLNEAEDLPATAIFINSGVRLVASGSPVVDDLTALCDKGVEVLACGTCLDYFKLRDRVAVGQVTNMYSIVETLLQASHIISV